MSNFQLAYETKDGKEIILPANINTYANIDTLKRFAESCGYSTDRWTSRDDGLSSVFGNVTLKQCDIAPEGIDLSPFKSALSREDGLFELPWTVFENRFKDGVLNTLLDENGTLVGTMNVIPKLNDGIKGRLEIKNHPDNPQVYETGAGWTAPQIRGLGVYTKFRQKILEGQHVENRLLFSQSRGKGASNVNIREGWTLVNWKKFPFASALMGWPRGEGILGNKFQLASGLELKLPSGGLYSKPHIDFSGNDRGEVSELAREFQNSHRWDLYHHLWTNDYDKLKAFEKNLKSGLGITDAEDGITDHVYGTWLSTIEKNLFVMNQDLELSWQTSEQMSPAADR